MRGARHTHTRMRTHKHEPVSRVERSIVRTLDTDNRRFSNAFQWRSQDWWFTLMSVSDQWRRCNVIWKLERLKVITWFKIRYVFVGKNEKRTCELSPERRMSSEHRFGWIWKYCALLRNWHRIQKWVAYVSKRIRKIVFENSRWRLNVIWVRLSIYVTFSFDLDSEQIEKFSLRRQVFFQILIDFIFIAEIADRRWIQMY